MAGKGRIFVISGPSGTGKTSLTRRLLELVEGIELSLSTTTRPPRRGETDGVEYNFVSRASFERMLADNALVEHTELYGEYYGTRRADLDRALGRGADVLFEIDGRGAVQIQRALPEATLIFVAPPDISTLERRLNNRGTDSLEVIERRLANARRELAWMPNFDFLVVNDEFESAAADLAAIVRSVRGEDAAAARRAAGRRRQIALVALDPEIAAYAGNGQ